jgi:hypothetical protein
MPFLVNLRVPSQVGKLFDYLDIRLHDGLCLIELPTYIYSATGHVYRSESNMPLSYEDLCFG